MARVTHPPAELMKTNQDRGPDLRDKTLKKLGFFLLCHLLVAAIFLTALGDAEAKSRRRSAPPLPFRGYADLVIEADTGRIVRERSGNQLRYPASLTKMMTLYLVFQAIESGQIRLESSLPVSRKAASQPPSKLGLRAGGRLRVDDAIMALVTKSANDAAVVLAEGLGGSVSGFVDLMNKQARALGMGRTVFRNPSGLPDTKQVTTARDMATLALALVSHYPGFYPYFSRERFTFDGQTHKNHNHLMERYRGMDGIKTGYIYASGFNLVASAVREDKRLIGVIFGGQKSASRDNQMAQLLDATFAQLAHEKRARSGIQGARLALPSKVAVAFPAKEEEELTAQAGAQKTETLQKPVSHAWGVQIGAFGDVFSARQTLMGLIRSMRSVLGSAQPSLQKITMTDGSTVYRARFVGLEQASARAICSSLIRKGQGCLVFSGS